MARAARLVGGAVGRWFYEWANIEFRLIVPSAYGDRRKLTPAILGQYFRGVW